MQSSDEYDLFSAAVVLGCLIFVFGYGFGLLELSEHFKNVFQTWWGITLSAAALAFGLTGFMLLAFVLIPKIIDKRRKPENQDYISD